MAVRTKEILREGRNSKGESTGSREMSIGKNGRIGRALSPSSPLVSIADGLKRSGRRREGEWGASDSSETERLSELARLGIVGSPRDPEFDLLTEVAAAMCGTERAFVTLVGSDYVWVKSSFGVDAHGEVSPRKGSPCALALACDSPLVIRGQGRAAEETRHSKDGVEGLYVGAQLRTTKGVAIGTLCVADASPRRMTHQQVRLLERLASQVMALIELRADSKTLACLAATDPLTGLANRRFFDDYLASVTLSCGMARTNVSLVYLDLDHFKSINDTYGHDVGDQVLVAVAGVLRSHVRSTDVVCRFGGEEFGILLPGVDGQAAGALADRIRQSLCHTALGNDHAIFATGSFGVTSWRHGVDSSPSDLVRRADQAAYAAKNSGRNRVVVI